MRISLRQVLALSVLGMPIALTACGDDTAAPRPVSLADPGLAQQADAEGSSGGLHLFGGPDKTQAGTTLGVNAYLWRGALDTLSFMPLLSADPFGGVIITDWYQPPGTSGERFKATAYILGRQLRTDGIRISIFRQVQQPNGVWIDAPVSPQTTADIENKALARARELRASSSASN
jgi:hypothetical protein